MNYSGLNQREKEVIKNVLDTANRLLFDRDVALTIGDQDADLFEIELIGLPDRFVVSFAISSFTETKLKEEEVN